MNPVHRIQPGRGDPHPKLSWAGLWRGNLADLQNLWPAEGIELDRGTAACCW
ncbi:MAG: hypothetical protein L0G87_04475 [Renibacterium salmoninarum]|nr:hypothetical protein [Renibacterium salmoninarum]